MRVPDAAGPWRFPRPSPEAVACVRIYRNAQVVPAHSVVMYAVGPVPSSRPESPPAVNSVRSEEHTSELQSLMRISYAVFYLKKKKDKHTKKYKRLNTKETVPNLSQLTLP